MMLILSTSCQLSHCQDCPNWDLNPWSLKPGGQDFCLRMHGYQDWYKQDLYCLLKWIIACIHFGYDFCPHFQYNIMIMVVWVGLTP